MFGLADSIVAMLKVECMGWKVFAIAWCAPLIRPFPAFFSREETLKYSHQSLSWELHYEHILHPPCYLLLCPYFSLDNCARLSDYDRLIIGPVGFLCVSTYMVYLLVSKHKTLAFNTFPRHSISEMWTGMKNAPGIIGKLSQLFVYFMDFRFVGGWGPKDDRARYLP